MTQLTEGVRLIAEERQRQIEQEGYTPEHDAEHDGFELSTSAAVYAEEALHAYRYGRPCERPPVEWPYVCDWKPSVDPVRNLVKAGALIAAEIDRLRARP